MQVLVSGPASLATAALSTAAQCLSSFGKFVCRDEKEQRVKSVDEAIPVIQYFCSKLEECQKEAPEVKKIQKHLANQNFWINCLDTILKSLNKNILSSEHFSKYVWQKLCPMVIKLADFYGSSRKTKSQNQVSK